MMVESQIEVPILIVGGGPVGLSLSIDLGWRGIECLMIERRDGSVGHPKMNQVGNRTQEFCRRWGLGKRVRQMSIPEDFPRNIHFVTSTTGYELGRYEFPARQDVIQPYSPEFMQRCSQIYFDPLLRDTAAEMPTVMQMFDTRLYHFEQEENTVIARIIDEKSGEKKIIKAQYLIACDGADSEIRDALGIKLIGDCSMNSNINLFFKSNDHAALFNKGRAIMQWIFDEEGMWADIVSINGNDLWRLSIMKLPNGTNLSMGEAENYLRKAVGREFEFEILSILPWMRKRVVADCFSVGRIHLCGDAVHQMSPTGGFGMNTGIGEAVDLSWKLSAVLEGWGGGKLLDSYDAERRPLAKMITDEGARNYTQFAKLPNGSEINQDTVEGELFRKNLTQELYNLKMDREYDTDGVVLGYHYEGSPIIVPDGTPEPNFDVMVYTETARPGHRAPHAWVDHDEQVSTLDLFGKGFTLLCFDSSVSFDSLVEALNRRNVPITVEYIDQKNISEIYKNKLVLVRPDGHVAWRGDSCPVDALSITDIVRGG